MFQPRLKLRPPIETFANAATLAALAEAAKTVMDAAEEDRDNVQRRTRDFRARAEIERQADGKVAKALMQLNLYNALEALFPIDSTDTSADEA